MTKKWEVDMLFGLIPLWAVQAVAGIGYLLQKVFLYVSEGKRDKETNKETLESLRWRIAGWTSYLIGLPMWLAIFVIEDNWMLFFVEGGGFPSMLLGLTLGVTAYMRMKRGRVEEEEDFDGGADLLSMALDWFAFLAAIAGVAYSVYLFGGLTQNTQWLELGVSIGFLVGTYLLAKEITSGWLWYVLMNGSAGTLMLVQGYYFLTFQQAVSLTFVILAYRKACRRET